MKIIKKNVYIFITALIIRRYLFSKFNLINASLDDESKEILRILKRDGIVTIPDHFSKENCEKIIGEHNKYSSKHSIFCKENERRIFGIHKLSKSVDNIFSKDDLSWKICEAYLGEKMTLQTTMSANIKFDNLIEYGSGGSWHRDSYSRQIKSIGYLTDMTDINGPFMFIKGSHKLSSIIKILFHFRKTRNPNDSRYTKQEISEIENILGVKASYFECKRGVLVLADIRGLHTTRYLKGGFAYSIFNYYIAQYDDNANSSIRQQEKKCLL